MNNINPFTVFDKQWALVSAGNKTKSNTMTVSWGALGTLWHKSVAFVFVRDSRYTKEFLDKAENFSVSFLDESYRNSLTFCGRNSGRNCNKWEKANLTPVESKGTVYPKEAHTVLICKKLAAVKLSKDTFIDLKIDPDNYPNKDYHTMYIGEVIEEISL